MRSVVWLVLMSAVAQDPKTIYVSASGDDANDGAGPGTPLLTLSKAGAVARAGDTIRLKSGDVFYGTFRPSVTGSAQAPVTVEPYGDGPKPVLTGLRPVTGWRRIGAGRYEATLAAFPDGPLEMVRFDGRSRAKGRWPKKGLESGLRIASHFKNSRITTRDEVPDGFGGDLVQKKYQWIIDRGRIDAITRQVVSGTTETTFEFTDYPGTRYECFDEHRFFIQNHVKCLTEPGDWCYDVPTRKLTVFAGDAPPAEGQMEAAGVDVLADLADRGHVRFRGLAFVGANADAVRLNRSPYVSLEDCDLSSIGRDGLHVVPVEGRPWHRESHHVTVKNCRIRDVNNNGIDAGSNPHWTIVGNTIDGIGLHPGMGRNGDGQYIGIFSPGDESLVQHNEISNIGYIGVHFVGSGTQVRNNHVHHFCLTKSDGGGIYTYGGEKRMAAHARPRVVDGNIVHHGVGNIDGVAGADKGSPYAPQCQGIYMDGNATDVIVSHNTVFKVASAGLWLGSNGGIRAFGNTLADNHFMQLGIDDQTSSPTGLEVRGNLCFAFEREQLCLSVSLRNKPEGQAWPQYVGSLGVLANNLYCRPIREPDGVSTRGYPHVPTFKDYPGGGVVSTSWDGLFLSLDVWKQAYPQDVGSSKTSRAVDDPADLRLEYNPTTSTKDVDLPGEWEDARGRVYRSRLTLEPYASAVLLRRRER
jgi:hypothetical protein